MIELLDPNVITESSNSLEGTSGFPDTIFVIAFGNNKFAAVNATTPPPDPMTLELLSSFLTESDASTYFANVASQLPPGGEVKSMLFEEFREIAKSKPAIKGIALWVKGAIALIHYTN